jgi:hypothetical protein
MPNQTKTDAAILVSRKSPFSEFARRAIRGINTVCITERKLRSTSANRAVAAYKAEGVLTEIPSDRNLSAAMIEIGHE